MADLKEALFQGHMEAKHKQEKAENAMYTSYRAFSETKDEKYADAFYEKSKKLDQARAVCNTLWDIIKRAGLIAEYVTWEAEHSDPSTGEERGADD